MGNPDEQLQIDGRQHQVILRRWVAVTQLYHHRFCALAYRQEIQSRIQIWQETTSPALAA
jgi:hypothetical protein